VLKLDSSGAHQWHTFYSGTSSSSDAGIAVDGSGNVYVTGYSYASWNGPGSCTVAGTSPCPLNAFSGSSGSYEIFALKLDTNGAYQWHTFYGSSGYDLGHGVAVDGSGNVYVTGQSGATWGSPLHSHSGGWYNLFVLKLDTNGAYNWHTFYGSSDSNALDYGNSISLDGNGNIYVAGKSDKPWGDSPINGHTVGDTDVFVLKLDNNGIYKWHTFYGPSNTNQGVGLALDTDSNVYVTSTSTDWGSPLHGYSGSYDIIVLKLDSDGAYQWHTFYGSGDDELGYGIAVDGSGNVYVTGTGNATWGSPLRAYSGNSDAFLFKLDTNGAFKWNTFYGSGVGDEGWAVAVDTSGRVSLTGGSYATWGAPVNSFIGNEDVFVLRMNDSPPLVTTTAISAITQNSANSGGNVISDGWDAVTAKGVCWNTSINPTISNDHTTNGSGIGIFTSQIDSLSPVTSYHVRAYATNGGGTFYGDDISFTTNLCTSDVQRGGTYGTIQEAITSGSGAEITAVARVFPEALLFTNSSALALNGGYACGFGSASGITTVHGTITIAGSAAVTLGNVAVY
jgi:hypothetical protein